MKKYTLTVTLSLAALALSAAGNVMANDNTPKTRAQVQAELIQAQRNGDLMANNESGLKFNEINPSAYPAKALAQGKTRDQVKAELVEASRSGDLVVANELGLKLNEINPSAYPVKSAQSTVTRAEVRAQLKEAQRKGEVLQGETGQMLKDLNPRRYSHVS